MITQDAEIRCENCRFYVSLKDPMNLGAPEQGECRGGPPTAVATVIQDRLGAQGIQISGHFPPVKGSEKGCGAYRPKMTETMEAQIQEMLETIKSGAVSVAK